MASPTTGSGQPGPPSLSDQQVLEKYQLQDPGTDAHAFAQQVFDLAGKRRAVLHCKAEYKAGQHVVITYHIWGTDSVGHELTTASDSARTALANIIRELNKRYARRRAAEQFVQKHA